MLETLIKMAETVKLGEGIEKIAGGELKGKLPKEMAGRPSDGFAPPWKSDQARPIIADRDLPHDLAPPWKTGGLYERLPDQKENGPVVERTKTESDYPSLKPERAGLIKNKEDGLRRESEVEDKLKKKYSESEGYTIEREVYLRDKDGNIVKDPVTGEARRIDFVVIKDGEVIDSIEVTSKTAPKDEQIAKENRIRENGGNYIKDSNGNLVGMPSDVQTRIERRD
jgi:hypothetical protein